VVRVTTEKSASEVIPEGVWNALVAKAYRALADEAPVWEEDFPAGTGLVVGVMDAAVVCARLLGEKSDSSSTTGGT
jgi:hypothetical protein